MPLWSQLRDLPQKPRVNFVEPTRNVVATEEGWQYHNGNNYEHLIDLNNLAPRLGDNKFYKFYLDKENNTPGSYSDAKVIVEFIKPIVINNSSAILRVYVNSTSNYYDFQLSPSLSNPHGGTAVFVLNSFSFTASDDVYLLDSSVSTFNNSISAISNDTISFSFPEEGVPLYNGVPEDNDNPPPPPPSS